MVERPVRFTATPPDGWLKTRAKGRADGLGAAAIISGTVRIAGVRHNGERVVRHFYPTTHADFPWHDQGQAAEGCHRDVARLSTTTTGSSPLSRRGASITVETPLGDSDE